MAIGAAPSEWPYRRDPERGWIRTPTGEPVPGAVDLTLGELFDPPLGELDGAPVRLVPRAWASRHPDHPLAWIFAHAEVGDRGPVAVPAPQWDERAATVVALGAPELHPFNLVGIDGVAALAGVSAGTVRSYLARQQLPAPLLRLGGSPVWSRLAIERWAAGRRGSAQAEAVPPTGGMPRSV
jgi:hypothetical protein